MVWGWGTITQTTASGFQVLNPHPYFVLIGSNALTKGPRMGILFLLGLRLTSMCRPRVDGCSGEKVT